MSKKKKLKKDADTDLKLKASFIKKLNKSLKSNSKGICAEKVAAKLGLKWKSM